jgi:hypothetical protein
MDIKKIINLIVEENNNIIEINKEGEIKGEKSIFKTYPLIDDKNNKVVIILINDNYFQNNYKSIKKTIIKLTNSIMYISKTKNKWYTINVISSALKTKEMV